MGRTNTSDADTPSATVLPSGSGTSKTVQPQPGDNITCSITNSDQIDLTVTKTASTPTYVRRPTADLPDRGRQQRTGNGSRGSRSGHTAGDLRLGGCSSWTCTASAGSSCTVSGSGNINDTVTLVSGGTVTYTVTVTAPSSAAGSQTNTATVTPPPGTVDSNCTPNCSSLGDHVARTRGGPQRPEDGETQSLRAGSGAHLHGHGPEQRTLRRHGDNHSKTSADGAPEEQGSAWTCAATSGYSCTADDDGDVDDTVDVATVDVLTYADHGRRCPQRPLAHWSTRRPSTPPPAQRIPRLQAELLGANAEAEVRQGLTVAKNDLAVVLSRRSATSWVPTSWSPTPATSPGRRRAGGRRRHQRPQYSPPPGSCSRPQQPAH